MIILANVSSSSWSPSLWGLIKVWCDIMVGCPPSHHLGPRASDNQAAETPWKPSVLYSSSSTQLVLTIITITIVITSTWSSASPSLPSSNLSSVFQFRSNMVNILQISMNIQLSGLSNEKCEDVYLKRRGSGWNLYNGYIFPFSLYCIAPTSCIKYVNYFASLILKTSQKIRMIRLVKWGDQLTGGTSWLEGPFDWGDQYTWLTSWIRGPVDWEDQMIVRPKRKEK